MNISGDTAGIDIGSRSIELVVMRGDEAVHTAKAATTFDPVGQCRALFQGVLATRVVATGYGRKLFVEAFDGDAHLGRVSDITEIQAYALGVTRLFPQARTILDIGGQDSKVISLGPNGRVLRFEMNDRCAAGTGKFLEIMALSLQVPLTDFGAFALSGDTRIPINSMCTVFAESEATSLMARGERAQNIALGIHLAIMQRIHSMLRRVGQNGPLVFAGGVARNPCAVVLLRELTRADCLVPQDPDLAGALGACLYAQKLLENDDD
ncbi:MAG: acyl-CoA dehydratase activase [Humidesulfovibrio sp.]|nr:acyl-CoA dehydratase activase [Humidesulfovibrio sp.]